ncbi:MAG: hypothetical protein ACR2QT_08180 [Woeseiaceae bacterium]
MNKILEGGKNPIIQFSKPGYSACLLKKINTLCEEYEDKLTVRFYAHDTDEFDASVVKHLPDVQYLSVDCLMRIKNEDEIARLRNLRKFSFGVYYFDNPGFLKTLDLAELSRLTLSDTKKKNFDLSPLSQCEALEVLSLNSHTKNIASISQLPKLTRLHLGSIGKRQTLEFVNEISNLEKLTILLGGRENIGEVEHYGLNDLEIIRVRALNDLGDLTRFPNLRRVLVEDQIQLRSISFVGTGLEDVRIRNCKNLEQLDGLFDLTNLRAFHTWQTKLDLDALVEADWPESMGTVAIYSNNQKWNDRARQILDDKGLGEFP